MSGIEKSSFVRESKMPKRIEDMTPEERTASLSAFLEEQKYIQDGDGSLVGANSRDNNGGYNSVFIGSPWQGSSMSFKMAPCGHQGALASDSAHKAKGEPSIIPTTMSPPSRMPSLPSYETATGEQSKVAKERTPSPLRRFLDKRRESKGSHSHLNVHEDASM